MMIGRCKLDVIPAHKYTLAVGVACRRHNPVAWYSLYQESPYSLLLTPTLPAPKSEPKWYV